VPTLPLIAVPALMTAAVMLRLKAWLRIVVFAILIAGELAAIGGVTVQHVRGQIFAFAG
jgi:hypothetical protein